MILDYDDLQILREFYKLGEKQETTTWRIMKKIYPNGKEREHQKIKRRIEKMAKYGFFYVNGNPKNYILLLDKIVFKKFNFPHKRCEGIALCIEDKWEIIEL